MSCSSSFSIGLLLVLLISVPASAQESSAEDTAVSSLSQTPVLDWPDLSQSVTAIGGGEYDAALIVAIEDYDHVIDVPGAHRTANDWYAWFVDGLQMPIENVKLMPQRNATREEILIELQKKAETAGAGGRFWFVFIGHGAPAKENGVLLGVDVRANPISIEARGMTMKELLDAANDSAAQPVFIVDACFSGESRDGSAVVEGLMPLENVSMPKPGKAIVATASAGDEYAGALPGGSRPAFSYLTLGALQGWGDKNMDGKVTAAEMTQYSKSTLGALLTGRTQTPELIGTAGETPLAVAKTEGPDIKAFAMELAGPPKPEEQPVTAQAAPPVEKQEPPSLAEMKPATAQPLTLQPVVEPQPAQTEPKPIPRKRRAGLIVLGAAAAVGITGAIVGGVSMSKESKLRNDCYNFHCFESYDSDISRVKHLNTAADLLYVTAGITAVAGAIITVVQARQHKREIALTPALGPHTAAFTLKGTF